MNRWRPRCVSLGMRPHPRLAVAAVAALAALLAGCGSGGTGPTAPAAPPAAGYVVERYTFPPLSAAPGQTVQVTDADAEPHTVTAQDGSFDTGTFDRDAPGRFTAPTEPGTYAFGCTVHPSMRGTLTIR